uniref:Wzz domain-containing protein n=1 Tax=Mesocestoides corti TaxID=53468 RepID=A0A5K3FR55_MESCO
MYLAMVSDRLFLCIFVAACLAGALAIIAYSPSLYENREALTSNNIPRFINLRLEGQGNASASTVVLPNI